MIDSWDKVSFKQFRQIKTGMPVSAIVAILENRPESEVLNEHRDVHSDLQQLGFLNEQITPKAPPAVDLEQKSIGQFEDMKQIASEFKGSDEDFDKYPLIYATYQFHVKPYDPDIAESWVPEFEQLPCTEIIGAVQHYLSKINRIEEKWSALFPKSNYTAEQITAGFENIDKTFKFYGTLLYMEASTRYTRDQLLKLTVSEFKYNLLYLAWRNEANKKYADAQANKAATQPRGKTPRKK